MNDAAFDILYAKACRKLTPEFEFTNCGVLPELYTEQFEMPSRYDKTARRPSSSGSAAAPQHSVLVDIAVGLVAGLVATQVTNLAQGPLRWATPDSVDQHEKTVRPGASSSLVAAQKIAETLDVSPSAQEEQTLGTAIHFATGIGWGPVYGLLRRYGGLRPVSAAVASGLAMSLILDEGLVPALGLSAPNRRYPTFTRVRGFVAHLIYGAAVAVAAEGLGRLVVRPPRKP